MDKQDSRLLLDLVSDLLLEMRGVRAALLRLYNLHKAYAPMVDNGASCAERLVAVSQHGLDGLIKLLERNEGKGGGEHDSDT